MKGERNVERGAKRGAGGVRAIWLCVAAAIVVSAAGGFLIWKSGKRGKPDAGLPGRLEEPGPGETASAVRALVKARLPERVKYPVTEDGTDFDGESYDRESYDRWFAQRRENVLTEMELEAMSGFFQAVTPVLLGGDGGNAVCSPVNIYEALSMLCEVTDGQSRGQILGLLGSESVEEQRRLAGRVWNALYNDDGTYESVLASSVWLRAGDEGEYDGEVLGTLAEEYFASAYAGTMGSEEMDGMLSRWLEGQTGGLLDGMGDGGFEDETVMAIASTAYFSDRWELCFDSGKTARGIFHGTKGDVERDFMEMTVRSKYYRGEGYGGVELDFETGGTMRLLLPDEGVDAGKLLEDAGAVGFLTGGPVDGGVAARQAEIHLRMPKFDVSDEGYINGALMELGVTDIFAPTTADFTPLVGEDGVFMSAGESEPWRLYVSKVLHGARVRVDEEGCEAAAYTLIAVDGAGAALPEEFEKIEFVMDRPFLFSVVSKGVPMFVGVVEEG